MHYKALLAAVITLPLLLACDRSEQSPTAANPSQERRAMTPDSTIEKSPPAAGTPSSPADVSANPAAPSSPSTPSYSSPSTDNPPASSPSEPKKPAE